LCERGTEQCKPQPAQLLQLGRKMGDGPWERFEDQDVPVDEPGWPLPAISDDELAKCKEECLNLGYGGFVVRKGLATFRPQCREDVLKEKVSGWGCRGAVLHVAPAPAHVAEGSITVVHGDSVRRAPLLALASKSGYFASLSRHAWADGESCHSFAEFPGGEDAFAFAMSWLAAGLQGAVGSPWPVHDWRDVCKIIHAASYLDSPGLLCAATRSWRLAVARGRDREHLLQVAVTMGSASLQFSFEGQEPIIAELRAMLQELPKHHLPLAPDFLAAPAAGLVVLEVRHAARETLVGHIQKVGNRVGSVIGWGGGERVTSSAEPEALASPHDFAARLFDAHEPYFLGHLPALRQLLPYVDPATAIAPPLCFRIAAAALAATSTRDEDGFLGQQLSADIFTRSIGAVPDPAQAASESACVVGLFGAGASGINEAPLSLEILSKPEVPPAAAAVVLSRVLSSWAIAESHGAGTDGAEVVLAAVTANRQRLRSMLVAVLPCIAAESGTEMGTEWGSSFDYAVPELRAAFTSAAAKAAGSSANADPPLDETLRLLFRVVYQPSGGLPDVPFPLSLLAELREHSTACAALVAQRVLLELRAVAARNRDRAWAAAEALWPAVAWESIDEAMLGATVELLRMWLRDAKAESHAAARAAGKAIAVRLLRQLPLHRLRDPEELLGPPIPAHILACLAHREQVECTSRLMALEAENEGLRQEVARLASDRHRSG